MASLAAAYLEIVRRNMQFPTSNCPLVQAIFATPWTIAASFHAAGAEMFFRPPEQAVLQEASDRSDR